MGAWKNLNQQDVYITTYTAKKSWSTTSGSFGEGIRYYTANTHSTATYDLNPNDIYGGPTSGSNDATYHSPLVFKNLAHMYFQDHDTGSGELAASSSFEVYKESSLSTGSRALKQQAFLYSIPRNRVGTHIEPGSLTIGDDVLYLSASYVSGGYVAESQKIFDDSEGGLRENSTSGSMVGSVVYSHGQLIITEGEANTYYRNFPDQDINWKSNVPIYTYNYTVKLSDYEFNFTQNPSALTGSDNRLRDNITGSSFQPYITTVGLYNDSNELIAVAKLGKALPKSRNTETTIQVKLDI